MTKLLYWLIYHVDLGPLGPKALDLAVQSWLKRAHGRGAPPIVRRTVYGFFTIFQLQPRFGADERM